MRCCCASTVTRRADLLSALRRPHRYIELGLAHCAAANKLAAALGCQSGCGEGNSATAESSGRGLPGLAMLKLTWGSAWAGRLQSWLQVGPACAVVTIIDPELDIRVKRRAVLISFELTSPQPLGKRVTSPRTCACHDVSALNCVAPQPAVMTLRTTCPAPNSAETWRIQDAECRRGRFASL
jgi:hypothetical protein